MSIVSTLALMASAVIARVRKPSLEAELAALQARLDDLNRRYDEHLANVTRQRDDWQALAERFRDYAIRPTRSGVMLGQTVFNSHNLQQQIEEFVCNCVPARHDMFLRG